VQHLEDQHGDLIGQAVDVHSNILLPRWDPFPPSKAAIIPPRLPPSNSIPLGISFAEPIIVKPTPRLTRLISDESGSLPISHTPKSAPQRRTLQSSHTAAHELSPPKHNPPHRSPYDFANLPDIEYHRDKDILTPPHILEPPHFTVQKIGEGLHGAQRRDLARPLPMPVGSVLGVDSPPPPTSIFYDALRRQVLAEYAEGQDVAMDER
jgi:hypothetical protein